MKTNPGSRAAFAVLAFALIALPARAEPPAAQQTFATPKAAADALVTAAADFDVAAMLAILGPEGNDLVVTGDPVLDRNQANEFASEAKEKVAVVIDPKNPKKATLTVGREDWPVPIPIVQAGGTWRFDSAAGHREVLIRRIGRNELDAIQVCRGYVEAQDEYASELRGDSKVHQYAQRVIGTADKQDGLAWKDADGTWRGPVGEKIAQAIAEGYSGKNEPYHGYYFKILKGQGPHAPLGELDYVIKGMMIGGFALVASPAEYEVTGIKTFLVSNDGVVYEKDLRAKSLEVFQKMERFDPDDSWTPVEAED